jgi:DNA-binding PadR family transcriptional regulator
VSAVTDARGRSSGVLDLALLGVLADAPMHGYQLRTRLAEILGPGRSYSYGSLYPALRRLHRAGDLAVTDPSDPSEKADTPAESSGSGPAVPGGGEDGTGDPRSAQPRGRVTYRITATGIRRLCDLLADDGPQSWTDEGFVVHLALFARTPAPTRLRILQGRRRRLEQLREGLRACLPAGTGQDDDLAQFHRLAIQAHDREMLWIRGLIAREGSTPDRDATAAPGDTLPHSRAPADPVTAPIPVTEPAASATPTDPTTPFPNERYHP